MTRIASKILALSLACSAAPSLALAQAACLRPAAPVVDAPERGRSLTQIELERRRVAVDQYSTAMDAFLDCANSEIERRMKAMFASNAPLDPGLDALGAAHRSASEERAGVHERYVRLCLAWEEATNAPPPSRCAPSDQGF